MQTTATATQIHELELHRPFRFVDEYNGTGAYVKTTPRHYRRAGNNHAVSLPIRNIRTLVIPINAD